MVGPRVRPIILKAVSDSRLDDYVYPDLKRDHRIDELKIDMIVTTSQWIDLYTNIKSLLSGKAKNLGEVINADQVSIKEISDAWGRHT